MIKRPAILLIALFGVYFGHSQELGSRLFSIDFNELGSELFRNSENGQLTISVSGICSELQTCQSFIELFPSDLDSFRLQQYPEWSSTTSEGEDIFESHGWFLTIDAFNRDSTVSLFRMEKIEQQWVFTDSLLFSFPEEKLVGMAVRELSNSNVFTITFTRSGSLQEKFWFQCHNQDSKELLWDFIYERLPGKTFVNFFEFIPDDQGGIYIMGYNIHEIGENPHVPFIEHYDSLGQLEWRREYGRNNRKSVFNRGFDIRDDGEMYLAFSVQNDTLLFELDYPIIYRLDEDGNVIWRHIWADETDDRGKDIFGVLALRNGDVLVYGQGFKFQFEDGEVENDPGMLARISEEGELLWYREYVHDAVYDGEHYALGWFNDALELPNGNIVATGMQIDSTMLDDGSVVRDWDVWLIQVDSNGCLEPGCEGEQQIYTATVDIPSLGEVDYHISPNPFTTELRLAFDKDCRDCSFILSDMSGREYLRQDGLSAGQTIFHTSELPSGYYIGSFIYEGQVIGGEKLLRY